MIYLIGKIGFTILASSFCGAFLRADLLFVFGGFAFLGGICFRIFSKKYSNICAIFIAAAVGFSLAGTNLVLNYYPAAALSGHSAEISGVVTDIDPAGGNPVYTVKTDYIGLSGAPQNIKIKLSGWNGIDAEIYDKISCKVNFASYGESDFSEILSNRSKGISVYAYLQTPVKNLGEAHEGLDYGIYKIRKAVADIIFENYIGWHASFMGEMLIDYKSDLEDFVTEPFRKSGMSHILAISGLHLVIIVGPLEKVLLYKRKTGFGRKAAYLVLGLFTAFYMLIGGLGVSVVRAGFMLISGYITKLLFCGSKSVDNLGLSIILLLILDPAAAYDIGFLLSVFACGGLAIFASPLAQYIKTKFRPNENRFTEFIIENFASSVVASLSVIPVSVIAFGEISLAAPITNVFAAFFAQYSLIFGVFSVLFGFVPIFKFAAAIFAGCAMLCNEIMLKIAEIGAAIPFSYVTAKEPWIVIWIIGSLLLFALPALFTKSFKYVKYSAAFSAVVLAAGIAANAIFFSGVVSIDIFALEHGTAVQCSKGGEAVLITHNLSDGDEHILKGKNCDIISLEPETSSAEYFLAEETGGKNVYFSTEDALLNFEGANPVTEGKIEVFDGGYVEIINQGVYAAEFDGTKLLYISEECDIMKINPKFRRCDILILDGVTPENFANIRCDYLIFRKHNGYFGGAEEKIIVLKEDKISFFAYGENVKEGGF